jgi:uncharacterized protein (DUF924 family)
MSKLPMPTARDVLDFWFGDTDEPREAWFRKDPAFDESIRARFGSLIDAALAGAVDGWAASPDGALARLVVLDQFTRNCFRGSARAFAGDALALAGARAMVTHGDDLHLPPLRRVFAYLPFEHSEDPAMQRESVRLFEALAVLRPSLAGYADYARRHAEVIERFGRFPHRNAALGRESSADEMAWLALPGSGF